jgi:hypothetical protein
MALAAAEVVMAAAVEVVMAAAVEALVDHAAAEAVVTEAAVAVVVAEAETVEPHAEQQGVSADPLAHTDGALRLNSRALFILNALSKILKLRKSHGYRTYSLHHQA